MKLYQLAVSLRAICDNNKALLLQVIPRLGLDEQELRSIVESACNRDWGWTSRSCAASWSLPARNRRRGSVRCCSAF